MIEHIGDCIVALAALVGVLDYFGIKPKRPVWGILMPLTKNWKLGIMLTLVIASLGMSGYGFFRSLHPKIVEKIVEKPVDRVVGKTQPECPKQEQPTSSPKQKASPKMSNVPAGTPSTTINAPYGIGISGGHVENPTVNNFGKISKPDRRIKPEDKAQLITWLSQYPAKVSVSAIQGSREAFTFAQDWYDVLKAANWEMQDEIVRTFLIGGPPWAGVQLNFYGDPPVPRGSYQVPPDTPAGRVVAAFNAEQVEGMTGNKSLNMDKDLIVINIGPNE